MHWVTMGYKGLDKTASVSDTSYWHISRVRLLSHSLTTRPCLPKARAFTFQAQTEGEKWPNKPGFGCLLISGISRSTGMSVIRAAEQLTPSRFLGRTCPRS